MNNRTERMQKDWKKRSLRLGNSKKAVLFKRFPGWLNNRIHKKHVNFILKNLPVHLESVLDVGCGYGRLTQAIHTRFPGISFTGVDFCDEFSLHYSQKYGPCHCSSIQEFETDQKYDLVIAVTILMYIDASDLYTIVQKLWSWVKPGGALICIESAVEFNQTFFAITGKSSASPTGGDVSYYSGEDFISIFNKLKNFTSSHSIPIGLLGSRFPVHHAIAIHKDTHKV